MSESHFKQMCVALEEKGQLQRDGKLATATASRVMRAISSEFTNGDAAKPYWPFTITRTPNPKLFRSVTNGTSSVILPPRWAESR